MPKIPAAANPREFFSDGIASGVYGRRCSYFRSEESPGFSRGEDVKDVALNDPLHGKPAILKNGALSFASSSSESGPQRQGLWQVKGYNIIKVEKPGRFMKNCGGYTFG